MGLNSRLTTAVEKLNLKLLSFFTENYKPGIVGIVGTKGTIGMAIREAQKAVAKFV